MTQAAESPQKVAPRFLDRTTPPTFMTLVAVTGIAAMPMNIFLPSLPHMAAEFGTDYSVIQLSVALYLALTGATQVLLGPLADRYGRRPVLLAAYGIFVLASLGCRVQMCDDQSACKRTLYPCDGTGSLALDDALPLQPGSSLPGGVTA